MKILEQIFSSGKLIWESRGQGRSKMAPKCWLQKCLLKTTNFCQRGCNSVKFNQNYYQWKAGFLQCNTTLGRIQNVGKTLQQTNTVMRSCSRPRQQSSKTDCFATDIAQILAEFLSSSPIKRLPTVIIMATHRNKLGEAWNT